MPQRILVVDDDLSIIKVLRGYLEQSDYQVLTATDGETALHMLRRHAGLSGRRLGRAE